MRRYSPSPVLQSGEQGIHCIEADGAKQRKRFAHGPFHLVLVEILH